MSILTDLQCSLDPPGFICVHNSLSLCLSPPLFPSVSHFHSFTPLCLITPTPTYSNEHTAYKYTDSHNHQIILLLLSTCGTPTALAVNYSIQRARGALPARRSYNQNSQKNDDGANPRENSFHMQFWNFLSCKKPKTLQPCESNGKTVIRTKMTLAGS